MKALDKCVNGCNTSPKKPSKVLCAKCLRKLGEKIQKMVDNLKKGDRI